MSENKAITADEVFNGLFAFLKANPWLVESGSALEEHHEQEAVAFLLQLASGDVQGWGETPTAVRATVIGLLMDFMGKLRAPHSSFHNKTWQVNSKSLPWRQALEVIALEIRRSHPLL